MGRFTELEKKATLEELEIEMQTAQRVMGEALLAMYPEGHEIGVLLNCRQVYPTWAIVIGVGTHDNHLRVRLVKPDKRGRHHVCDVHFSKVVCS